MPARNTIARSSPLWTATSWSNHIIAATQAVLGDMTAPDTGILFVMPVTRVVGVPRRGHNL
jgi:hypothetical protein